MWFFIYSINNKKYSNVCVKMLRNKYKDIIIFLKKSDFISRRVSKILSYKKNNIIITIDEEEIVILDLIESRTYTFSEETTSLLIIDFLIYLNNQYQATI